jgi:hypothetical protein
VANNYFNRDKTRPFIYLIKPSIETPNALAIFAMV